MRARTLLALWLALAIAALPFSMAAMMRVQAATPHVSGHHRSHDVRHARPAAQGPHWKSSSDAGQKANDHHPQFAQCAAAQMMLPAACDAGAPLAADAAARPNRFAVLAGQKSAPATPPPRG